MTWLGILRGSLIQARGGLIAARNRDFADATPVRHGGALRDLEGVRFSGRACVHCGDQYSHKRSVPEGTSHGMVSGFECADVETCLRRICQLRLWGISLGPAPPCQDAEDRVADIH
jgi:hypothetical protein